MPHSIKSVLRSSSLLLHHRTRYASASLFGAPCTLNGRCRVCKIKTDKWNGEPKLRWTEKNKQKQKQRKARATTQNIFIIFTPKRNVNKFIILFVFLSVPESVCVCVSDGGKYLAWISFSFFIPSSRTFFDSVCRSGVGCACRQLYYCI